MAACYLQLGRYDRAAEACNQALALDARNVKAMYVAKLTQFPESAGTA